MYMYIYIYINKVRESLKTEQRDDKAVVVDRLLEEELPDDVFSVYCRKRRPHSLYLYIM